jgi:hypothetical protein
MSFFNALLGAMNKGGSIYNEDKQFENTLLKDKATYDNTRSSTALNTQSFGHKEKINPFLVRGQELANMLNEQKHDFNTGNNPYLLENSKLTNIGVGYDNTKKFNENSSFKAFMDNPLNNAQTLNNYQGTYGNARHNPTNANKLNMGQTLIDIATGGGQPVTHQGKQYEGQEQLDALQTAISSLMSSGKGSKIDLQKIFSPDGLGQTGYGRYDPVSQTIIPVPTQNNVSSVDAQSALNDSVSQTFGTTEFNNPANQAEYNIRANEVYQFFLDQTKDHNRAVALTNLEMNPQLKVDDDWFTKPELDYTPNNNVLGETQPQLPIVSNDAEYMALPAGSKFIDPQGNVRTKAE